MTDEHKIIKSTCELCNAGCGVLVHIQGDKPVKVEGNPENPVNRGVLCPKGLASLDYLYHPDRVKYPMKRTGKRGEGKWQRITWDEALNTIAARLTDTKEKYGVESISFVRGGAKGLQDAYLERLANLFGVPNVTTMASVCHSPRVSSSVITHGFLPSPDYEYTPACIIMWGQNNAESGIGEYRRANEALNRGSKLIVIDPWETGYARRADIWIKPRPCTDSALALGMLNVIIAEGLYDADLVKNWTSGFDKLKTHITEFVPDKVAEITWVPADLIRKAARLYAASNPACIAWGNGLDNNINNFQGDRAINIMRAITGNLDVPGGDIEWSPTQVLSKYSPELQKLDAIPGEIRARRLSASDNLLPTFPYSIPQTLVKSLLTGEPYKTRVVFLQGGSLLQTYTNAKETYEALSKLDFLAATDFFMTPTVEMADIVLPVSTYLETNSLHVSDPVPSIGVIQKVAQIGECKSDYEIAGGLGRKLGLGQYFWDDQVKATEFVLSPSRLTFEELKKLGFIIESKQYRKYLKKGFNTPSHKVELFSTKLAEWGFSPLPVYIEPPESPVSEPELAKEYPLVFTNRKLAAYQHSAGRQIRVLRESRPEPVVHINSHTAQKLGISEGDLVFIETKRGKIKQKANLNSQLDPRLIIIDYGWWFPEKPVSELHGWAESNVNILTNNKGVFAREMGSAILRGQLCKVYKAV